MTVLITGANGHIGANLVRALIQKGQPVRCLVHEKSNALEGLPIEKVHGDIRDAESLRRALEGVELVYHLAGYISISMNGWEHCKEINITGTRNIVEACLQNGVRRLVHFSSIHALQHEPMDRPVDEENPLVDSPLCPPYDRSKAAGEREVRRGIEQGLDAVVIYPTAVIGPNDYQPSYLGEAILMMARGKLPALVKGGYDWVDARDVAEGAITAAEKAPKSSGYLLSGHWVSMCDLAGLVAELTGASCSKFVCPSWLANIGAIYFKATSKITGKAPLYTKMSLKTLLDNKNISHERAARELEYQPRPFRDTLEDTLRWFHDNNYLKMAE